MHRVASLSIAQRRCLLVVSVANCPVLWFALHGTAWFRLARPRIARLIPQLTCFGGKLPCAVGCCAVRCEARRRTARTCLYTFLFRSQSGKLPCASRRFAGLCLATHRINSIKPENPELSVGESAEESRRLNYVGICTVFDTARQYIS